MEKDKARNYLFSEEGGALVLTLMVFLILSVLGVAVGTITVGSHRLSDANRDSTSAYYVAEAGANTAYEEISKEVLNAYRTFETADDFYRNVQSKMKQYKKTITISEEQGNQAMVNISELTAETGTQAYSIMSKGKVDGRERTVEKKFVVEWKGEEVTVEGVPPVPDGVAVVVRDEAQLLADANIFGDVYIDSLKPYGLMVGHSSDVLGNIFHNPGIGKRTLLGWGFLINRSEIYNKTNKANETIPWEVYENYVQSLPHYPQFDKKMERIPRSVYRIDGETINNTHITEVNLDWLNSLTINTNNNDVSFSVNRLSVSGGSNLKITGKGKVNIYVKESFDMHNLAFLNIDGNPKSLNIYYYGKKGINVGGLVELNGNLYLPNKGTGVLNLSSGISMNGTIISNGVDVNIGNFSRKNLLIVAPFSQVNLIHRVKYQGILIADRFSMIADTSVTYKPDENYLFVREQTDSEVDESDIIKSQPVVEVK